MRYFMAALVALAALTGAVLAGSFVGTANAEAAGRVINMKHVEGKATARARALCNSVHNPPTTRCVRGFAEGCRRQSLSAPHIGWCYAEAVYTDRLPQGTFTILCESRVLGEMRYDRRHRRWVGPYWRIGGWSCMRAGRLSRVPARTLARGMGASMALHRPYCGGDVSCVLRRVVRPDAVNRCGKVNGHRWRGCRERALDKNGTVKTAASTWGPHSYRGVYSFRDVSDWPLASSTCNGSVIIDAHTGKIIRRQQDC